MTRNQFILLVAIGLSASGFGCRGGSNLPEGDTGTVSGRVTYNGQTVPAGSTVIFMGSGDGIMGTGVTNSSGEYVLTMREGFDILVGSYRVSVTPPNPASGLSDEEVMERHMSGNLPDPAEVKEVPLRYRSPESSSLVCQVKAGQNTYDIDMKD